MQLSFGECDGLNQDELCENVLNTAHASTNTDDFRNLFGFSLCAAACSAQGHAYCHLL